MLDRSGSMGECYPRHTFHDSETEIGGIDIELTSAETAYMNKRGYSLVVTGMKHLDWEWRCWCRIYNGFVNTWRKNIFH